MAEPIKFTKVNVMVNGKGYSFNMQEGISIRDKKGKEFLFENGKWKVWKTDERVGRNGTISPVGGHFEDYEEYEGGFLGLFKTRKQQPDIELDDYYKRALEAVMDNDGIANDLTIKDIDKARKNYKEGKLKDDFKKHGVDVSRHQGESCGVKNHKLQVNTKEGVFRIDYFVKGDEDLNRTK